MGEKRPSRQRPRRKRRLSESQATIVIENLRQLVVRDICDDRLDFRGDPKFKPIKIVNAVDLVAAVTSRSIKYPKGDLAVQSP